MTCGISKPQIFSKFQVQYGILTYPEKIDMLVASQNHCSDTCQLPNHNSTSSNNGRWKLNHQLILVATIELRSGKPTPITTKINSKNGYLLSDLELLLLFYTTFIQFYFIKHVNDRHFSTSRQTKIQSARRG